MSDSVLIAMFASLAGIITAIAAAVVAIVTAIKQTKLTSQLNGKIVKMTEDARDIAKREATEALLRASNYPAQPPPPPPGTAIKP